MGLSTGSSLSSGGGGSGGITLAQVQGITGFEFIKQISVISGGTNTSITNGVDVTKYSTHYFVCENLKMGSSDYPQIKILDTSSTALNGAIMSQRYNTSYTTSRSAGTSTFYLNGSNVYNNTDVWNMDIEVTQSTNRQIVYTRTSMGREGGHYPQFTMGNIIIDRATSGNEGNFGGIDIYMPLTEGTIKLYGRRIRTT
tara:strand:- start:320 stop:913 length:594 start_codon:yes stop_codon:yes gene_type:complete